LAIELDTDGCIQCTECDFFTTSQDYDTVPLSGRAFMLDKMEEEHGTIDYARDEQGLDAGRSECQDAWDGAKCAYEELSFEEKLAMHNAFVEKVF